MNVMGATLRRGCGGSRLGLLVIGLLAIAAMAAPSVAVAASPTVSATNAVSASGSSTVQLNGTVDTSSCGGSFVSYTFQFGSEKDISYHYDPANTSQPLWGEAPNNPWGIVTSPAVSTTLPASGAPALMPDTVYHWRLAAFVQGTGGCADGWTYSDMQCFELGQGSVPCPAQVSATFTVVNQRGRAQQAVVSYGLSGAGGLDGAITTPDGKFTTTVQAGELMYFSRSAHISGNCAAPEGQLGLLYTVPDNPQSQVTIQLDNTTKSGSPDVPALSPAERWVIGKINDMRQAKGLSRLRVSTTLDRVAYATAHDAAALKAANGSYPWPPKYCAAVGVDWGWPQLSLDTRPFGGNDAATTSSSAALAHWTDTSARGQLTFNSAVTAIGIADGGGAWTMFVSDCSNAAADVAARCEMTSDTGDASIELPPSGGGGGSGTGGGTGGGSNPATAGAQSLLSNLASRLAQLTSGAVLKANGASIGFKAAGAGQATASCDAAAHPRRLKLMGGASKVLRARSVTLHLRLTAGGRKLLKQAHKRHRPVHARCKATFVPRHGKGVTKTKPVTLAP